MHLKLTEKICTPIFWLFAAHRFTFAALYQKDYFKYQTEE